MELTFFLLCFCSTFLPLLAYPMDYNETAIEITSQALGELQALIYQNNFPVLLQQYNDEISKINSNTYEKITSTSSLFSQRLLELEETASNSDTDVAICLENVSHPSAEELFEKYTEDCANPARALGLNLMTNGFNRQTVVFYNKYNELMTYFNGCIHGSDPAPYICAGIVESTLQEVRRITPAVRANPVETQRNFDQQLLVLSDCANNHVVIVSQRFQIEYDTVLTCVLDKINTA